MAKVKIEDWKFLEPGDMTPDLYKSMIPYLRDIAETAQDDPGVARAFKAMVKTYKIKKHVLKDVPKARDILR